VASKARRPRRFRPGQVKVVDLFCGIGGLSHGLLLEGFHVAGGVDNDETCKYAFEQNNNAKFFRRDIAKFTAREISKLFDGAAVRVLVGCAPCQPFSSLNRRRLSKRNAKKHWYPLYRFQRIIRRLKPEIVSMENVPELANGDKYPVFNDFLGTLQALDYHVTYKVVDASRYGVPQRRRRLVLLASRLGPISLVRETHDEKSAATVKQSIKSLPRLKHGGVSLSDPLHRASRLSDTNQRRIAATPRNGGSATSWKKSLMPKCYRKKSGKSYMVTVYGRMRWNDPAPTITTQCTTLGTGRFGHPSQNRAISLREAALLQSFPRDYKFAEDGQISMRHLAKHIGNAVPVLLGCAIGRSIKKNIREHA